MALEAIVNRTRSILYGTGLGEKPALRLGATDAAETTSGQLVTFTLLAGEGAKCKPGQVLSVYDPDTETDAHAIYITSISTDTVTGVNKYLGSPAVVGSNSGDLDLAVFEQNPLATMFEIYEAIDTIFAHQLWPYVYDITTDTIAAPDLVDGQEAVAAAALEIISAYQIVGSTTYPIPFDVRPKIVHTDIASTGKMATFGWYQGTTGYYTYKEKFAEADEATDELTHLVAVGAAAMILGGHLIETSIAGTKAQNKEAVNQRNAIGSNLWRDFLTLRQGMQYDLGTTTPNQILIDRG